MSRFSCFAVLIFVLGCNGNKDTVPVEGILQLDGQPLKGASVQFVPEGSGRDATATTDDQGRFVLSTFEPKDGALPGNYKVVITPAAPVDETQQGMTADEAMAAASAAAAKPQAKPTGPTVPEEYTRPDQTPVKQKVPHEGNLVIDIKSK